MRHLNAISSALKYEYSKDERPDYLESSKVWLVLKRLSRQLAAEEHRSRIWQKSGALTKQAKDTSCASILEICKTLRQEYEDAASSHKGRYLHDFVMVSYYLTVSIGRSAELYNLRLVETDDSSFVPELKAGVPCNFIVFYSDGRVNSFEANYKTVKSYGPNKIEIHQPWLRHFIKVYQQQERSKLMHGQTHDYFFLNNRGEPFSVSSMNKYLGALFERHINARLGTTAFRHAIITHFLSLKESEDLQLSESLARAMKHSRKMQQSYEVSSNQSKSSRGRAFMNSSFEQVVLDDLQWSSQDSQSSAATESEIKLRVNDMVALQAADSCPKNVKILLGKVIRFSDDGSDATLLEFKEISANLYKAQPGSVWQESVDALIFPVDVVFNRSEMCYQLNCSPIDLYRVCFQSCKKPRHK